MYVFQFDKRSLVLMAATAASVAVLLFVGGLLVGVSLNLPASAPAPPDVRLAAAASPLPLGGRPLPPPPPRRDPSPPAGPASTPEGAAPEGAVEDLEEDALEPPPVERVPALPPAARSELSPAAPEPEPSVPPWAQPASPVPAVEPPTPPRPEPAGAAFAVQVAAYSQEVNARREVSTLTAAGYEPLVVTAAGAAGRPLFRVVLGRYADRGEADSVASRFVRVEGREAWVRRLDL